MVEDTKKILNNSQVLLIVSCVQQTTKTERTKRKISGRISWELDKSLLWKLDQWCSSNDEIGQARSKHTYAPLAVFMSKSVCLHEVTRNYFYSTSPLRCD